MKTNKLLMIVSAGLIILLIAGCEIGNYPLILDASGKSETIHVTAAPPDSFSDSVKIPIADLADLTDYDVDSVTFYNLTLDVDSNYSVPEAAVDGEITVNGNPLLSFTNVLVTQFTDEKSIFDRTITGYSYHAAGVLFLLNALRTQSPEEIEVKVTLHPVNEILDFKLTITLYSQVFATS